MPTPLITKPFLTSFFSIIISVFAVAFIANATSTISTNIHTDGTLSSGLLGTASGSLSLKGLTSGIVSIVPGDTAGTWTLTLPTTDGNDGEVLTTNGSGVTSWAAPEADRGYEVYTALIKQEASPLLTSGSLIIGHYYYFADPSSEDDFTNVGGNSNVIGVFKATGTTPTLWNNSGIWDVTPVLFVLQNDIELPEPTIQVEGLGIITLNFEGYVLDREKTFITTSSILTELNPNDWYMLNSGYTLIEGHLLTITTGFGSADSTDTKRFIQGYLPIEIRVYP
jgi:hypothetical protein